MTIYATRDADGHHIGENATIRAFDSRAEALEWLAAVYRDGLDEGETITFEPGQFGDCWIKSRHRPTEDQLAQWCKPFGTNDIIVRPPTDNPGAAYWLTPYPEVLVGIVEAPCDVEG